MKKRLFFKRIIALASTVTVATSLVITNGVNVLALENQVSNDGFTVLGNIEELKSEGNKVNISTNPEKVQVTFLKDDVFRIWMDPKGEFKDPTEEKILAKKDYKGVEPKVEDKGEYYKIATPLTVLRAYKKPLKFAMYDKDDKKEIWKEKESLKYNGEITEQTLDNKDDEDFYGCGVQNGYFSHKNKDMHIGLKISHWNDGAVSNPVPFYMSTAGYGVFRNTFEPGDYSFKKIGVMSHKENRFDAFYFAGDLKKTMNSYTELTGRPSLLPRWGFGMGDADCYNTQNPTYTGDKNKPGKVTTKDVLNVIKKYRELDMPGSWVLPNDGYGCGYEKLGETVSEAAKQGFKVGLWTQKGVDKIATEVGVDGTRLCKLDVAWVGPGYEYALNASKSAYEGIENNSNSRGFVWGVCGWAGTQRYSTVWTGDQTGGDFEYIRYHIPSVIGGGLSGMPYVSSDTDGIFGGKAKTYTRDLQWKTFIPTMINMSGWAQKDKQPWIYGEPYTSINRKYLKLRQAMMPYMYTTAAESYKTGAPINRAMVWEFPSDPITRGKDTQYQFMLGENLLVAPIYEGNTDDITKPDIRNGIYFPKDTRWIDFWTGKQYEGGKFLNGYEADINTVPVFVKSGSIIPMYPECNYDGEKMPGTEYPLTLNVYPCGNSEYNLYEDDGNTKEHRTGKYATTKIQVSAPNQGTDKATIRVNATEGSYKGMAEYRKHEFVVHTKVDPEKVIVKLATSDTCDINGNCGEGELKKVASKEEWEKTACCSWYFDANEQGGVVRVKTKATAINKPLQIELDKFNNDIEKSDESLVAPSIPENIVLSDVKDNEISIKWDAVKEATSYDILVDGAIYENVKSPYIHTGLNPVSKHAYKVRAVNKTKAGEWSKEIVGETKEDRNKNAVDPEELSATANSEQPGENASKAIDGDLGTLWHSDWFKKEPVYELKVDIEKPYDINKIIYHPRNKGSNGVWTKVNVYGSTDGKEYKKIFDNLELKDTGLPHELKFETIKGAKSFKFEILKGNGGFASAIELQFFKDSGEIVAPGEDMTADKKVDINDLNFMVNYYRVAKGDNDWNYVLKGDFNEDNVIGIFDVARVISKIDPKLVPSGKQVSGNLYARYDKENVKAGDNVSVQLYGDNLNDVYAFESVIPVNNDKFDFVEFKQSELSKDMAAVAKMKNGNIYLSYSNKSNQTPINKDGLLAEVVLKAKVDGKVELPIKEATLVGTNLKTIDAVNLISYDEISRAGMTATATSEEVAGGDKASNVLDGNVETLWHTKWNEKAKFPVSLNVDLNGTKKLDKVIIIPRAKGSNGVIKEYKMYATVSGKEVEISKGTWEDDGKAKEVVFAPVDATKIRVEALSGKGDFASMTEIKFFSQKQVAAKSVYLNKNILELKEGKTDKLVANLLPLNTANKNVTWKSSDDSIVIVDKEGTVKAIKEGTAKITVSTVDGGFTETCSITVKSDRIKVTNVVLDKNSLEIKPNEEITLVSDVQPANATNKKVIWASSDESVANVNESGKVTAIKEGNATITVTTEEGKFVAACAITVKKASDPVKPVDPVDPVKPGEPTKPSEPVKPIDPTKPVDPIKPVETTTSKNKVNEIKDKAGANVLKVKDSEDGNSSLPKTGNKVNTVSLMLMATAFIALGIVMVVRKRKQQA